VTGTWACRSCGSPDLSVLLDLGNMPLAGGFLDDAAAAADEQWHPLVVHVCERCCLPQIVEPVDPDVLFQDYSFSASTIPGLVRHFDGYAGWIHERFDPGLVVEFGANDGVLLAPLEARGIRAVGVDISQNITDLARDRGLTVVTGAFDTSIAEEIREAHGPADVVTGSNVFAHNADPSVILEAARAALADDGVLCLEVMYARDLADELQWDTLYHEHLTFYALGTLAPLLAKYGFTVVHAERSPMHGGSLRVAAQLGTARPDDTVAEVARAEHDAGLDQVERWLEFARLSRSSIQVVQDVFDRLSASAEIWAYGAAGKATMWVNACKMSYLGAVVDASPLRAGKLMPGTHTPIVAPEQFQAASPDFVLVTAWNYLDAIRSNEPGFEGIWATPLPALTFHH
jgi:novobiocin biosynthesis protein NovU/D-mycarose 3-C-methyltransferase